MSYANESTLSHTAHTAANKKEAFYGEETASNQQLESKEVPSGYVERYAEFLNNSLPDTRAEELMNSIRNTILSKNVSETYFLTNL
jgi:hypothetical protein